ncbi:serine hydrolase domain-containing protein [Maricaulis sp.]|uniref:serine hydrolase domain-containing protein n=1 Tax=Maricaulis sp. TaxID=1486257 RepID=UPI0025C5C8DE|nr:serine hydrolase domain-containing protein [Maricaulis sp.]
MIRTVFASLVLLGHAASLTPAHAQPGAAAPGLFTLEDRIRDWVAPLVETRDFSGVIMLRYGDAEPVALTFGYADWVSGDPMTARARFPAGSISKGLTAAMVRRLIGEGRMAPGDPINRYIPELTGYDQVRIADILAHTAGLPRDIAPGTLADDRSNTLVAWLARQPAPGPGPHAYAYSNLGYGLLAVAVERAANARFETLIAAEFLVPLDMQASRIVRLGAPMGAAVPRGFAAGPLPLDLRAPMPDSPALGASGLVAPVGDLLRLADAVRTRRVDLFEPDGRMAGGWQVEQLAGETIYTVQGSVPGYSAGISILPGRDITLAYGTNIESYSNWELRDVLHALALGLALEPAATRPATDRLTSAHLEAAGAYSGSPYGPVVIEQTESGLDLVLTERDWRFYLTPTGPDALNWRLFNADFSYERDAAGRVSAIAVNQRGLTGPATGWRLERADLPPLPTPTPGMDFEN